MPSQSPSQRLRKIYDPRKWSRRSLEGVRNSRPWDGRPPSGYLWLWAGRLRRWKRRWFSAMAPGLLTYSKSRTVRGKSGTINLQGATLCASENTERQFCIKTANGSKFYLRTTEPEERQSWIECIQASGATYGKMLSRASQLLGLTPDSVAEAHAVPGALHPRTSAQAGLREVAEAPVIIHKLASRVQKRMEDILPYQHACEEQLSSIQSSLHGLAASLSLDKKDPKASSANESRPQVPDAAEAVSGGDSSPPTTFVERHSNGTYKNSVASPFSLPKESLLERHSLQHAESFQSARSLQGISPSASLKGSHQQAAAGPATAGLLGVRWRAYTAAVQEGLRAEAVRVIELEAENEALKAGMREFKNRAKANAARLRSLTSVPALTTDHSLEVSSSSSEDDYGGTTPRQLSLELQSSPASLAPQAADRSLADLTALSSQMGAEYREALEALEMVQKHAFHIRSSNARHMSADLGTNTPPEEGTEDVDDAPSDDEGRSEMGSSRSLQVGNVWEVAAARDRLPAPAPLQRGFSIWSVLKNAIGRDLTRITLPATINEPLSALQRAVEDLEYRHLLDQAQQSSDPAERMLLVAAFIASGYSNSLYRESKPFNPLLGETYEWQAGDASCRFVCEQVSHHPPVSCFWSEGAAGWVYWGEVELRSKFWGKSVEMNPTGSCWLQLDGELYSWNKASMSINNIIMGRIWLEWYGDIVIRNHTSGLSTSLKFLKSGGKLEARGKVHGSIPGHGGQPAFDITGNYTSAVVATPAGGGDERELFRVNPPPEDSQLQYNMTRLALTLNTAEPALLEQLPPTDSRFRPDQRALEDGDLERATPEKLRLEEKQREARKHRKVTGELFEPRWFKLRKPQSGQLQGADHWLGTTLVRLPDQPPPCLWEFTGEYWRAKAAADWAKCPDIYSEDGTEPSPSGK